MSHYKVLLTGASGFLGWHLCQALPPSYEVAGTYFRNRYEHPAVQWQRINLLESAKIPALIQSVRPDIIIHAAAVSSFSFCEQHPALSHHLNVYASLELAKIAHSAKIPFVFISSDLVFNGSNPPYDEWSFAYPISKYGEQKLLVEEALIERYPNASVWRIPLLMGWGLDYMHNFLKDWVIKWRRNDEVQVFTDEYRTPLTATNAARWIWKGVDWRLHDTMAEDDQILHFGGDESISRYDLAYKIARAFGIVDPQIQPLLRSELLLDHLRPEDVSLNSERAQALLGFFPPDVDSQLEELVHQARR